jgi:2-iminobutanoate/2-iminopropanoate deaminase
MVNIEVVNPGTPVAGPYSPALKVSNLLFVSGQIAKQGDIKEQTKTILENIKKIVETAGGKVSNLVKLCVFMTDIKEFSEMNSVYKKFFEDNGVTEKFPARSTVEVSNLVLEGLLIEIDAIAAL